MVDSAHFQPDDRPVDDQLADLRVRIDAVDQQLVALINQRARLAQAVGEDVGEAHDDWRRQVARPETLHDLEEIDLAGGGRVGSDDHVAGRIDAEIAFAAGPVLVELGRIFGAPALAQAGLRFRGHATLPKWRLSKNGRAR
mgnify:CR=1 FL=1